MRQPLLVTAALYLAACAPSPVAVPCAATVAPAKLGPAAVATAEQVAAPLADPAGAPPQAPEVDRSVLGIPLPARTVCKVTGETPVDGVTLVIGEGLVLGDLTGALLSVHIPHQDDNRDRFVIEAELPGVTLRAFAERYSVKLHPTKAALFEFLVPRANALLTVLSATEEGIGLYVHLPRRLSLGRSLREYDSDDTVEGVLPCDALSLDVKPFDPFVVISEPTGQGALTEPNVTLASKPGGKAVGSVRLEQETDAHVAVLDRKKGWVKVAYPTDEAVAVGWVRKRLLVPSAPKLSFQDPSADASTSTADGAPRRILVCTNPVRVRGKVGKRAVTVGIVHPNQVMLLTSNAVGEKKIDLANHGLTLHKDAELWVADADLKGCKEQGP
ncbi:MAG: hypothetical protein HOV80_19140 [Polyangiaceae bacterium]|nr:hypothetical protein [Polyangiaceae bacterium]